MQKAVRVHESPQSALVKSSADKSEIRTARWRVFGGMGVWEKETFLQKGSFPQRPFPKVNLCNVYYSH